MIDGANGASPSTHSFRIVIINIIFELSEYDVPYATLHATIANNKSMQRHGMMTTMRHTEQQRFEPREREKATILAK